MNKILVYLTKALLILILFSFNSYKIYGEESQETESILQQLQILQKDIKTLEKAVYSQPGTGTSSSGEASSDFGIANAVPKSCASPLPGNFFIPLETVPNPDFSKSWKRNWLSV